MLTLFMEKIIHLFLSNLHNSQFKRFKQLAYFESGNYGKASRSNKAHYVSLTVHLNEKGYFGSFSTHNQLKPNVVCFNNSINQFHSYFYYNLLRFWLSVLILISSGRESKDFIKVHIKADLYLLTVYTHQNFQFCSLPKSKNNFLYLWNLHPGTPVNLFITEKVRIDNIYHMRTIKCHKQI